MDDLARVVQACRASIAAGRPSVLATVVKVDGSAYRRPGARMVFVASDEPVGMISGGCLEEDLALKAREVLDSGEARTVIYDMRSPDDIVWGLGLGCNGEVRVLLESPGKDDGYLEFLEFLEFLDQRATSRSPGVLVTVFGVTGRTRVRTGHRTTFTETGALTTGAEAWGPGLHAVERDALDALSRRTSLNAVYRDGDARIEALVEYVAPTVSLVLFGAGLDALPVVEMAKQLGWRVTVADHRPAYASAARFPQADAVVPVEYGRLSECSPAIDAITPVIVMTHHFLHDLALLEFLLTTDAPYVGVLGPRKRTEKLLEQLASRGVIPSEAQLLRLHGPVGLDIGSETSEEIALSALAEIRAVLTGRTGGFLRERSAPLHDPPS
jgi:xanthine dehydrogenase accessory factor